MFPQESICVESQLMLYEMHQGAMRIIIAWWVKINTKVKSCTNCETWQASWKERCPSFLCPSLSLSQFYIGGARNTSFSLTHLSTWYEILGRKMRDQALWWCPQFKFALKISTKHIFSSRNNSWEQRATFLSKLLNNINYSLQCPTHVGPRRRSLRIEHNKFRWDHWQPKMLLLGSRLSWWHMAHLTFTKDV